MNNLDIFKNKIINPEELNRKVNIWKFQGKKIVFTNGCFDILHIGHIHIINESAELGDFLIIGLNTDESIKRIKGENRPIQNESTRSLVLASLALVKAIVLFNEDTPLNLIKTIKPDVITKGGDYKEDEIVGVDFIKSYGGKIKILNYLNGYSTTLVETKIKNAAC